MVSGGGRQLVLMVGLPYAGKTTALRKQSPTSRMAIVSPDAVRLALHGMRYLPHAEPMVWTLVRLMVKAHFLGGYDRVVVDATHTTRKRRDEWRAFIEEWGVSNIEVVCWLVAATPEQCRERALAFGDQEILPTIDRMTEAFEPLADDEARF